MAIGDDAKFQQEIQSESTIFNRMQPGKPQTACFNETNLALDGTWQQPQGSTGWGFQAGQIEVLNRSLTNVLEISFDGGTTRHKIIQPGLGFLWEHRNDSGENLAIRGTVAEPYDLNTEK